MSGPRGSRDPHRTYLDLLAGCAVGRGHASRCRVAASPRAASVAPHRPPPGEGPPPSPQPSSSRRSCGAFSTPPLPAHTWCRQQILPVASTSPALRLAPSVAANSGECACVEIEARGVPETVAETGKIRRRLAAGIFEFPVGLSALQRAVSRPHRPNAKTLG